MDNPNRRGIWHGGIEVHFKSKVLPVPDRNGWVPPPLLERFFQWAAYFCVWSGLALMVVGCATIFLSWAILPYEQRFEWSHFAEWSKITPYDVGGAVFIVGIALLLAAIAFAFLFLWREGKSRPANPTA